VLNFQQIQGLDEDLIVDGCEGRRQYLVISGHGRPIRLSAGAHFVLKGVHAGRSCADLAQELSRKGDRPVSPADVEAAYRSVEERIAAIDRRAAAQPLPTGFWLRRRLLSAGRVARLAAPLAHAYRPAAAFPLLALIATGFLLLARTGLRLDFPAAVVWPGYALFLASLLVHELGHASACARYGAQPSEIGFTMYLLYPAFYSDVTAAWRLRRGQRVVVDLGGTYFQLAAGAVFAVAYTASGWEPLRAACFMIGLGALFSLNPLFKFDGYWVLADALGVANLSQQPAKLLRHALARLRGRRPAPLPWPGGVLAVLAVYAPLAVIAWAWLLARLLPLLIAKTLGYPGAVAALRASLSTAGQAPAGLAAFLGTTLLLALAWYGAWSVARSLLVTPAAQWLRRVRARRPQRLAVAHSS
jgi:putative peptide zinc metalloprotease protein